MGNDRISQALKRMLLVAVAGLLLLPAAASAAPPPVGGLAQLPGQLGCFTTVASASCQLATGINEAESVVASPDGRYVYVGSYPATTGSWRQPSLTAFSRDPATGQLTQLPGTAGCFTPDGSSQSGPNTCTKVEGLGSGDGRDFVITSDGEWAYMVNLRMPTAIVIFKRDPATGVLTQPAAPNGCISHNGDGQDGPGMCLSLGTISDPVGISISPDDRFVYITDAGNHSIHVLSRNSATGALAETQCLSDQTTPPTGCTSARVIGDVQSVVISPDGLHAYAAQFGNGISVFDRDPQTGQLTQKQGTAGCITDDGKDNTGAATCATGRVLNGAYSITEGPHTLYVTAYNDNGLAVFHVNADGTLTQLPGSAGCITLTGRDNTNSPTCAVGRALQGPYGLTVSPDDRTLYVTELTSGVTEGGVAIFSLDPTTGAATQLPAAAGCLTVDGASDGVANACSFGTALGAANQPVITPDGRSVYIASEGGQSVTIFKVQSAPVCQATSTATGYQAPVTITLSCTDRDGDPITTSVSAGPAHGTLGAVGSTVAYTPANGYTGTDTFTFDATDGTNTSAPATVTITVGSPPPVTPAPKPPAAVTHVSQSHRRWRGGKHGGTAFSFTLNEAARVTFTFTQRGHRRSRGALTIAGHAGKNKLAFNGRINRHTTLKPGNYTVTITAGTSTRRLTFTIVK
jgi:Big-like domain-containing protein/lactonase family protein with 7-bladed beta-propeller/WD40 repeat protein